MKNGTKLSSLSLSRGAKRATVPPFGKEWGARGAPRSRRPLWRGAPGTSSPWPPLFRRPSAQ
eukprot:1817091-Alexandrium_andersonii.AAC.1